MQTIFTYLTIIYLLKCRSWYVIVLSYLVLVSAFVVGVFSFLVQLVVIMYIIYTFETSSLTIFLTIINLEKLIRVTINLELKEVRAWTVRRIKPLDWNIAHDLKTLMQAFTAGIENLEYLWSREEVISIDNQKRKESNEVITLFKSTCCFMSMGINRLLDYRFFFIFVLCYTLHNCLTTVLII